MCRSVEEKKARRGRSCFLLLVAMAELLVAMAELLVAMAKLLVAIAELLVACNG